MTLSRWWRFHLPTFRWVTFRLHGEPPTARWMPLKVTQIVGGRLAGGWTWSLAITRLGPVHEDAKEV